MKTILTILLLLISSQAWSATWYVREDGGTYGSTATTCNGLTDAAYNAGTPNGPNCAVESLYEIQSYDINDTASFVGTDRIANGDTVVIGAPDGSGGSTDSFRIGYDSVDGPASCTNTRGCWLKTFPANTTVAGRGYDTGCTGNKAELWGTESVRRILLAENDNISIQCLEITDHSACLFDGPYNDGTVDGFPASCVNSAPYGPWAQDGIMFRGDDMEFKNLDIHGLGRYAITTSGDFGNTTFDNVLMSANSGGGFHTRHPHIGTGTVTLIDTKAVWNGCGERYPLQNSTINHSANIHHCMSQGQNGSSADGIAFGHETAGSPGNWTFLGGEYSHNTSDGIDTLHGNGTGIFIGSRMVVEGNAGSAIKPTGTLAYIENSKIIGNCGFFAGQTFTSTKANAGNSGDCAGVSGTWDAGASQCNRVFASCRANGDTLSLNISAGTENYLYNNTITGNGSILIYTEGSGCDANTVVKARNNIIMGGYWWTDDIALAAHGASSAGGNALTSYYYKGGSDGAGAGTCGGAFGDLDDDYNIVWDTKNGEPSCTGPNSICGVATTFAGTTKQGNTTLGSYYQGTDYAAQLVPLSTSSSVDVGVSGLTYQDGSADFDNDARTVPDIGAEEYEVGGGSEGSGGFPAGPRNVRWSGRISRP